MRFDPFLSAQPGAGRPTIPGSIGAVTPGTNRLGPWSNLAAFLDQNPPTALGGGAGDQPLALGEVKPLQIDPSAIKVDSPGLSGMLKAPSNHPGFFDKGGLGSGILNYLASGIIPGFGAMQAAKARIAREDQLLSLKRQWQLEDGQNRAMEPDDFTVGRDRVRYDPRTGKTNTIYHGLSDAEGYASAQGYSPGTDDYNKSMKDFVLRGQGPSSYDLRTDYEGLRQDDREDLEGLRQQNRISLRATPTYGDTHARPRAPGGPVGMPTTGSVIAPILAKVSRGAPLASGEQQALDLYYRRKGGGASGGAAPTATDASGNKVQLVNGRWVPIR